MRVFASAALGLSLFAMLTPAVAASGSPDLLPNLNGPGGVHGNPAFDQQFRRNGGGGVPAGPRPGGGPRPDGGPRFGGGPGGGQGYGGPRYDGDGGRYRHHGYGAAIGAGVAGLAAGAVIGGAVANQGYGGYGYGGPYDGGYGYAAPAVPIYSDPGPTVDVEEAQPEATAGGDEEYCASRYRTYDPASGTYQGYDGLRHPCP